MAIKYAYNVAEVLHSGGAGDLVLSGTPATGVHRTAASALTTGEQYRYSLLDLVGNQYEFGVGTWTAGTSTFTRTVELSSNNNNPITAPTDAVFTIVASNPAKLEELEVLDTLYAPLGHVGAGGSGAHPAFTTSTSGFVPPPSAGSGTRLLQENGSWVEPSGGIDKGSPFVIGGILEVASSTGDGEARTHAAGLTASEVRTHLDALNPHSNSAAKASPAVAANAVQLQADGNYEDAGHATKYAGRPAGAVTGAGSALMPSEGTDGTHHAHPLASPYAGSYAQTYGFALLWVDDTAGQEWSAKQKMVTATAAWTLEGSSGGRFHLRDTSAPSGAQVGTYHSASGIMALQSRDDSYGTPVNRLTVDLATGGITAGSPAGGIPATGVINAQGFEIDGVPVGSGGGSGTLRTVNEAGSLILDGGTTLNFLGAGVSVADAGGGVVDVNISGTAPGGGIVKGTPFAVGGLLEVESAAGDGTARTHATGLTAAEVRSHVDATAIHVDHTNVSLTGINTVQGGGDIAVSRTFQLVNDTASPGTLKLYGTNGAGVKGWHDQPVVITDHGGLGGLGDDDHTQYHNDARGDVRYYPRAEADSTFLQNVIEDTSPQLGGELQTKGNAVALTRSDDTAWAAMAAMTTRAGGVFAFSDGTPFEQGDAAVSVEATGVLLWGSAVQAESLIHSVEGGRQVYVSEQGVLYGVDPPPAGWTTSNTSTTTASLGSGETSGPWVDTDITLDFGDDVEIDQRLDVSVNLYIENRTDDKSGSISIGFGFNGASPTSTAATITIGEYFEGWVPVSFSTTADAAYTTSDDVDIFVRRESSDDSNFNPWLVHEGTAPHEGVLSTPGGSSPGGSGNMVAPGTMGTGELYESTADPKITAASGVLVANVLRSDAGGTLDASVGHALTNRNDAGTTLTPTPTTGGQLITATASGAITVNTPTEDGVTTYVIPAAVTGVTLTGYTVKGDQASSGDSLLQVWRAGSRNFAVWSDPA